MTSQATKLNGVSTQPCCATVPRSCQITIVRDEQRRRGYKAGMIDFDWPVGAKRLLGAAWAMQGRLWRKSKLLNVHLLACRAWLKWYVCWRHDLGGAVLYVSSNRYTVCLCVIYQFQTHANPHYNLHNRFNSRPQLFLQCKLPLTCLRTVPTVDLPNFGKLDRARLPQRFAPIKHRGRLLEQRFTSRAAAGVHIAWAS